MVLGTLFFGTPCTPEAPTVLGTPAESTSIGKIA